MKKPLTSWQIFLQCRGNHKTRERLFRTIWHQYQKRLLFFIRNIVKGDAEDVFQEIMLKIFQNIEKFNPLYSFKTWSYTIARNHSLNHIKKGKVSTVNGGLENIDIFPAPDRDSPENKTIQKELLITIDTALAGLSIENRHIAFLRFYEGMKHREIARIMDIPTGTVKSRLYATRTVLKKALEKYHET